MALLIYGPNFSKTAKEWVDFFYLDSEENNCDPRKSYLDILFDFCNNNGMILTCKNNIFGIPNKNIWIGFVVQNYDTFYYEQRQKLNEFFDYHDLLGHLTYFAGIKIEF